MNDKFGCNACWPESADGAWDARAKLKLAEHLIDESHFHVMTVKCPACGQLFVSVFTETIDWDHGEDPQYWILLPLTAGEAADLSSRGASLTEAALNALGPGRKSLSHDHPKGVPASSFWRSGILVGFHD